MNIQRAYKTELNLNNAQRSYFERCSDSARFVYNWGLADRIARYEHGEKTNKYEQKKRFNATKPAWMYDTPYTIQEQAFENVDRAYQNFFRRAKQGGEKPGFPKFKSRKKGTYSFTLRGCIHIEHDRVKLPRIGTVRLKERGFLPINGVKLNAVVVSEKAGRWFISTQVEEEMAEPSPTTGEILGVDFGIKTLATVSDGTVFENPRALAVAERKLKRIQREVSRRKKGSNNRAKSVRKLATVHARVTNVRRQALHQVSHDLTAKMKPTVVVIEDLNVSGMLKNHHLARAISDVSFGELRRELEYKGTWNGVSIEIADMWFASSKTCSRCGVVKSELSLSERTFKCESCGLEINRDLNAAKNLAAKRAVIACGVSTQSGATAKQEVSNYEV